jgi:peptide deformylase
MTVLPILPHDNPAVRKRAKEVKKVTPEIEKLIADMVETMRAAPGLGLAATQVGAQHRVIVVEMPEDEDEPLSGRLIVLINPEISGARGHEVGSEACLSVPGYVGEVERASECTVKGMTPSGQRVRFRAKGFTCRVFQHEVDHLDGKVYIDLIESPDKLRRLKPGEEEEPAG